MTSEACLNPRSCPVPDPVALDLRTIRTTNLDPRTVWYSVYDHKYESSLFNPSPVANGRFNALVEPAGVIPTLYASKTRTAALLETVFHDVQPTGAAYISEALALRGKGLRRIVAIKPLPLIDLRDDALSKLGLNRTQLISTSPMHYPCTRQWAMRIRESQKKPSIAGMLWRSRLTEIAASRSALFHDLTQVSMTDVVVLFEDRIDQDLVGVTEIEDLAGPQAEPLLQSILFELKAVLL